MTTKLKLSIKQSFITGIGFFIGLKLMHEPDASKIAFYCMVAAGVASYQTYTKKITIK